MSSGVPRHSRIFCIGEPCAVCFFLVRVHTISMTIPRAAGLGEAVVLVLLRHNAQRFVHVFRLRVQQLAQVANEILNRKFR